ncbi:hypothetical protein IJ732_00815 [bacterium]|nr:hypothetical protein [bacterium]
MELVLKTFELYIETAKTFLRYSQGFLKRHSIMKSLSQSVTNGLKDALTIRKKVKIAEYRVNYHKNQLRKMESLIASDNEHTFLRGQKLNQLR